MTDTANLGLPFIEGSQAQKHVTHNEALRILDAVIQVAVLDADRTAPPVSPAEGDRHIVAASPTGAWLGHATDIATWEDGAWRFVVPHAGWIAWSIADDVLVVFNGSTWRDVRDMPATVEQFGIHTTADTTNRLSVRSNAVLLTDIATSDGGSGDVRLQLSKQGTSNAASVVFSNAFSGRAEFGLIGSDAFRLKVSPDGTSFAEAFAIDQTSGNLNLPRALSLIGIISPAQITSNQSDYAPTGFSSASVVRLSTDATRDITGLAGGTDGRVVLVYNAGAFNAVLKAESASSSAANRFGIASDVTLAAKQGASLIYDGTASRWRQIGGSASGGGGAGTVTSVTASGILTASTNPITTSGTLDVNATITPQGRLTLTSVTPVLTASVSGATTIFYTPYVGNLVPLYDGTRMIPTACAELSQATTDTTKSPAAVAANSNYDLFVWSDGGTLRCTRGPAWSSGTARGTGAGSTELVRVNGLWLNAVSISNGPAAQRGTYVGTVRSNGSSQIDFIYGAVASGWAAGSFGVWNAYNRVSVSSMSGDTTTSWTYGSTTWRAPNGNTNTARVSFINGLNEDDVKATYVAIGNQSGGNAYAGVGYDSTSAPTGGASVNGAGFNLAITGSLRKIAGLGWHFVSAIEAASAASAIFIGQGSGPPSTQSAFTVDLQM